jgi:hypothetical protein
MLAKTIWLLLLCFFSCEFVMEFEGFDGAQVSSIYYIFHLSTNLCAMRTWLNSLIIPSGS